MESPPHMFIVDNEQQQQQQVNNQNNNSNHHKGVKLGWFLSKLGKKKTSGGNLKHSVSTGSIGKIHNRYSTDFDSCSLGNSPIMQDGISGTNSSCANSCSLSNCGSSRNSSGSLMSGNECNFEPTLFALSCQNNTQPTTTRKSTSLLPQQLQQLHNHHHQTSQHHSIPKRKSLFQFFSIFQNGGGHGGSVDSKISLSTPTSPNGTRHYSLKRFKFKRTNSATSLDLSKSNSSRSSRSHNRLPTSISCNKLNIEYISTKHEMGLSSPDMTSPTLIPTIPKHLISDDYQSPHCTIPEMNSNDLIPDVNNLSNQNNNEYNQSCSSSSNNNSNNNQNSNNTNERSNSISCHISSQREDSILNHLVCEVIEPISIADGSTNSSTCPSPHPLQQQQHQQQLQQQNNSKNSSLGNSDDTVSIDTSSSNGGNISIQSSPLMATSTPNTPKDVTKVMWSPSKIKGHLQTRSSAPQLGSGGGYPHNNSGMPKIGTHHWWGSHNPIPPEHCNLQLQLQHQQFIQQQQQQQKKQNPIQKVPSLNSKILEIKDGRSNSDNPLQKVQSINKWKTGELPSSPPIMSSNPPRLSSSSPDEMSPDACLSPISSVIRVYWVPLSPSDSPFLNSTSVGGDGTMSPARLNSSGVLNSNPWSTYWTHLVFHNTSVKEVIESLASNKLERTTENLKLCLSNNMLDYLEEDFKVLTSRLKQFYLMETPIEVIIHETEPCNVFSSMFGEQTDSSMSSLSSGTLANIVNLTSSTQVSTSSSSLASFSNLSSSWSPSYCKFLSPSAVRVRKPHLIVSDFNSGNNSNNNNSSSNNSNNSNNNCDSSSSRSSSGDGSNLGIGSNLVGHSLESDTFLLDNIPSSPSSLCSPSLGTNSFTQSNNILQLEQSTSSLPYPHANILNKSTPNNRYKFPRRNPNHILHNTSLKSELEQQPISPQLKEKIVILDNYFTHYYRELETYLGTRKKRMDTLHQVLTESGIKENSIAWSRCWKEHLAKESSYLRSKRAKIGPSDFQKLTAIGKGGFGKVFLARKKDSNEIVTLKVIRKNSYHRANQMTSVHKEKAVMMTPHSQKDTQWITRLLYSFHDKHYLYLAMEYHCGGDFRALLNTLVRLEDSVASFYMAEMILAVQSLHTLGYIHRDIKPSNFVVDKGGHLKLIDFGLSKEGFMNRHSKYQGTWRNLLNSKENELNNNHLTNIISRSKGDKKPISKTKITYSKVGSPEYMAPEMLAGKGYDHTYDYWSLGVVFFEMLFGETPFGGETAEEVFKNILDWKNILNWECLSQYVSDTALDLLKRLLCDPEHRTTSTEELQAHPYFEGLDWEGIKNIVPPFVPQVQNEIDTSYFEGAEDILDDDMIDNSEQSHESDHDEIVLQAEEAARDPVELPTESTGGGVGGTSDTSIRSMPFGGFNFQRFPSIVEGARAKGLLKSFYVEERGSMSRATSASSLSPVASCNSSPPVQSPTPLSPTVQGYQAKTPLIRVSNTIKSTLRISNNSNNNI